MKLLLSKILILPQVYFVTDRAEIAGIPIGVPFIFGDVSEESYLVRLLEYEMLYQAALKTGYPFNFKKILADAGFKDLKSGAGSRTGSTYMELSSYGITEDVKLEALHKFNPESDLFKDFIRDSSAYVDITILKKLKIFPVWLDKIEEAISTNIHNFATFNDNMYNKKLDGMFGAIQLNSPGKNLIIIDISGSIPRAVSATCLALAKNLTESFYADLMITGSKSTLYLYEEVYKLNVKTIYDENGMDNDQAYFKKLLTSEERIYNTVIVFGDNDNPGNNWSNQYNKGLSKIAREDGKKFCKWKVEKLISFHTYSTDYLAGYAEWFTPKETEKIGDWVKYLD